MALSDFQWGIAAACRIWGRGAEAPVGASGGGALLSCGLQSTSAWVLTTIFSIEEPCVHTASELKVNKRLCPHQKMRTPAEAALC